LFLFIKTFTTFVYQWSINIIQYKCHQLTINQLLRTTDVSSHVFMRDAGTQTILGGLPWPLQLPKGKTASNWFQCIPQREQEDCRVGVQITWYCCCLIFVIQLFKVKGCLSYQCDMRFMTYVLFVFCVFHLGQV
jgi:hypothetical protein